MGELVDEHGGERGGARGVGEHDGIDLHDVLARGLPGELRVVELRPAGGTRGDDRARRDEVAVGIANGLRVDGLAAQPEAVIAARVDDSIAEEIGILPGTELLSVNGRVLDDFLDWEFLGADEELVIDARLPSGEPVIYEIERMEGAPMGVGIWYEMQVNDPVAYLFVNANPEGSLEAIITSVVAWIRESSSRYH